MQNLFLSTLIISSFLFMAVQAAVDKSPFEVSVEVKTGSEKVMQKRAQLKMARSTSYCRGFYMPKKMGKWSCKVTGPGLTSCSTQYRCAPTTTQFNRSLETKSLRRDLNQMRRDTQLLKVKVSRKAYKTRAYKVASSQTLKKQYAPVGQKKAPEKKTSEIKSIEEEFNELTAFSEVEKEEIEKSSEEIENSSEDIEELEDFRDDESFAPKESKTFENKKEEISQSPYQGSSAEFAAFSGELISVSNNIESYMTLGLSWTPRKKFNSNFGMRGQFGLKTLKLGTGTVLEETFLVYELGLYGMLYMTDRFYAELGYNLEKWNDTAGSSFTALSFGLGYVFETKVLKIVDRVFFDYSKVSTEPESSSELKLAIGISF